MLSPILFALFFLLFLAEFLGIGIVILVEQHAALVSPDTIGQWLLSPQDPSANRISRRTIFPNGPFS